MAEQVGRNSSRPRSEAIGYAVAMARRIAAGEFSPPVGIFQAAQRIEHVVTDYPWPHGGAYPPAIADFAFGWNVSAPESDRAIIETARELVEQAESGRWEFVEPQRDER